MNLYDKLTDDQKKILEQYAVEYPHSAKALKQALHEHFSVMSLTMDDAHRLSLAYGFECTLYNILILFQ